MPKTWFLEPSKGGVVLGLQSPATSRGLQRDASSSLKTVLGEAAGRSEAASKQPGKEAIGLQPASTIGLTSHQQYRPMT